MNFWERLQLGCVATGQAPPSKADVARILKIQRSAVTKYEQGGFPSKRRINRLAQEYKLRSEWLLSGQGEMVAEDSLDEATLELLRLWRALDESAQQRVIASIRYEQAAMSGTSTAGHKALTEEIIKELDRRHGRSLSKDTKQ